ALRDLDRGGDRLRKVGEQLRHLRARLETMLERELAAIGLGQQPPFGDADERVVGLVILAAREERLVAGDERDAALVGERDQRRLGGAFGGGAVSLQFDVEAGAPKPPPRLPARAPPSTPAPPCLPP